MSFGYSAGDAILLTQLAWKTVQNARKACGEHDELTQEAQSLHTVIRRLEQELGKPTCPLNRDAETYEEQLEVLVKGCEKNLNVLDQVLIKYNALSEQERSGRRLWQKIRFGNGKMTDMAELRARLMYYTSAMSLFLNMVSLGTMGRVERQLNDAGGDLKEIKSSVNEIVAQMVSKSKGQEGSILTAYADDDRAVWKEFRRELVQDGFSSSVIKKHKSLIKSYIEELGSRGLLDDRNPENEAEEQDLKSDRSPNDAAKEQDFRNNAARMKGVGERDLESGRYSNGKREEQELINGPNPSHAAEEEEIKSDTNPNYEGEKPNLVDPIPNDTADEQDLKSDLIIDDTLSSDLATHRGLEASLGPQIASDSSQAWKGVTFTETFKNLSQIFEHRSKTVESSRVRESAIGFSFSRNTARTNSKTNLPLWDKFRDECTIQMVILTLSRRMGYNDIVEGKERRFSSLLTIASDHETLEVFVYEDVILPFIDAGATYRYLRSPVAYATPFLTLEALYQSMDKTADLVLPGWIKSHPEERIDFDASLRRYARRILKTPSITRLFDKVALEGLSK